MRQIDDSKYSQLLDRLRIPKSTKDDISILHNLVGTFLPDPMIGSMIIQYHRLHHVLNIKKVHSLTEFSDISIMYYVAKMKKHNEMSLSRIYNLRINHKDVQDDIILPLLSEVPLMIIININISIDTYPFSQFPY